MVGVAGTQHVVVPRYVPSLSRVKRMRPSLFSVHHSPISASPGAADGKIYLSNEDGQMLIIQAGATFKHLGTNSFGESLMATPALSQGMMYVRGAHTLFAIGKT